VITQRTSAGVGRALVAPGARRRQGRRAPAAEATMRTVRRSARLTVAVLVILAFVCPIYLTVVNAFKTDAAIAGSPESLPVHPTLRNLSAALTQPGHVLEIGLRPASAAGPGPRLWRRSRSA
jgi:ABC-type glycerol-3-phosphate transport system permease component